MGVRPMVVKLNTRDSGFEKAFTALVTARREQDANVEADVVGIIKDVRARGDAALIALTAKFDKLDLTAATLAITPDEMTAAEQACPADALAALDRAAARIEDYHQRQVPQDVSYTDDEGVRLGWRWRPIGAVGVYVPGGRAAYPSSVLMNVIPARIAGVGRIAMTVPAPGGDINPLVLAAAKRWRRWLMVPKRLPRSTRSLALAMLGWRQPNARSSVLSGSTWWPARRKF
jgi:histidinol dehydrogenase